MRRVTDGAGKAVVDMTSMVAEARVGRYRCQIVTLRAQRIVPSGRQVRRHNQIRDQLSRYRRLAHIVTAFEQMRIFRAVWTIGPRPAKFPVVVAVVTIRAQQTYAHAASLPYTIKVEHV